MARLDFDEVENRYAYHPPSSDMVKETHERIREEVRDLADFMNEMLPETREAAIVQTKLEEAMFWANAAVARNQ